MAIWLFNFSFILIYFNLDNCLIWYTLDIKRVHYLGLEIPACHSFPASVEIPIVGESAAQQDNFSEALLSENLDDRPGSSEFCAEGILGR